MAIVVDYTSPIPPAALKAAGVVGVCRYIAPQAWKRITLDEYRELVAAGIDVTLNWESDAHDWDTGAAGGSSHGQQAVAQARALGYPAGKVIPGSNDYDMTRTTWLNAGRAYGRAFAAQLRSGGYRPGIYGPYDVLTWARDDGIVDAFWQAGMSTSWSSGRNAGAWPGAHLRQRDHLTIAGTDTDWNEILIPHWGQRQAGVEDMTYFAAVVGTDEVFLTNGITARWVSAQEFPHLVALHNEGTAPLAYGASVRGVAFQSMVGEVLGDRPARLGPAEELQAILAAIEAASSTVQLSPEQLQAIIGAPHNRLTVDDLPLLQEAAEAGVRDAFAGGLAPKAAPTA